MRIFKPQKEKNQHNELNEDVLGNQKCSQTYLPQLKPPQTERTMMRIKAMMIARTMSFIFMF